MTTHADIIPPRACADPDSLYARRNTNRRFTPIESEWTHRDAFADVEAHGWVLALLFVRQQTLMVLLDCAITCNGFERCK